MIIVSEKDPYEMRLSLHVLKLLGDQLYSNIPKCISEAVANSWDADAEEVKIELDKENDEIRIIDDGIGMSKEDINKKYLLVGYRRREEEGDSSQEKGRVVMGRKGVGKLALFGISNTIEVFTKTEGGNPHAFRIDAEEIRKEIKQQSDDEDKDYGKYAPDPLSESTFWKNWPESQGRGTVIKIKELERRIVGKDIKDRNPE